MNCLAKNKLENGLNTLLRTNKIVLAFLFVFFVIVVIKEIPIIKFYNKQSETFL